MLVVSISVRAMSNAIHIAENVWECCKYLSYKISLFQVFGKLYSIVKITDAVWRSDAMCCNGNVVPAFLVNTLWNTWMSLPILFTFIVAFMLFYNIYFHLLSKCIFGSSTLPAFRPVPEWKTYLITFPS